MTEETYFKPKARLQGLAKVQKMVRDAYRQGGIKTWNVDQTFMAVTATPNYEKRLHSK